MTSLAVALQIAGAVALLLYGLRLVQLPRRWVRAQGRAGGQHALAAAGNAYRVLATLGLQSSTATALLVAGFAARELIAPAAAQVVLLGANLGTR